MHIACHVIKSPTVIIYSVLQCAVQCCKYYVVLVECFVVLCQYFSQNTWSHLLFLRKSWQLMLMLLSECFHDNNVCTFPPLITYLTANMFTVID